MTFRNIFFLIWKQYHSNNFTSRKIIFSFCLYYLDRKTFGDHAKTFGDHARTDFGFHGNREPPTELLDPLRSRRLNRIYHNDLLKYYYFF